MPFKPEFMFPTEVFMVFIQLLQAPIIAVAILKWIKIICNGEHNWHIIMMLTLLKR